MADYSEVKDILTLQAQVGQLQQQMAAMINAFNEMQTRLAGVEEMVSGEEKPKANQTKSKQ